MFDRSLFEHAKAALIVRVRVGPSTGSGIAIASAIVRGLCGRSFYFLATGSARELASVAVLFSSYAFFDFIFCAVFFESA